MLAYNGFREADMIEKICADCKYYKKGEDRWEEENEEKT